jgi:hypothetical protein
LKFPTSQRRLQNLLIIYFFIHLSLPSKPQTIPKEKIKTALASIEVEILFYLLPLAINKKQLNGYVIRDFAQLFKLLFLLPA